MNNARFGLAVLLLLVALTFGCASRQPDPLAGWRSHREQDPDELPKLIAADYHAYVNKFSAKEKKYIGDIHVYENGTGQIAIRIDTHVTKAIRTRVLVYGADHKRLKTMNYISGYSGH